MVHRSIVQARSGLLRAGGKVETEYLGRGVDPNGGGTQPLLFLALHSAIENGHWEIVRLLLEHSDPEPRRKVTRGLSTLPNENKQ